MIKKSDYKMIAIDLDGTLLTDDKRITEINKKVLKEITKKGIEIVIATGRRYYSAKMFSKRLGITDMTILANNGTIVRNIKDDKIQVEKYIDDLDFYRLVEAGNRVDLTPITHVNKYIEGYDMIGELEKTSFRYHNYIQKIEKRYKKVDNLLYVQNPNALSVVFPAERIQLEKFRKNIEDIGEGKYNIYLMDKLVGVSPILEIIRANCSKWHSIEEYATIKNINKKEIISIGDDMNDLEMIVNSGLGIAMKNATEEIKGRANIVTDRDNNNSGLGYVLSDIFSIKL